MADRRTRYKIPRGVKKEALDGRELRTVHGYGGGKVTKAINYKLRMQKDVGYDTAVKIDTYFRRHEKVDPPAKNFGNRLNPSKGYIMWKLMGGNAGHRWSKSLKKRLDLLQKTERLNNIKKTLEDIHGMVQ
tara:strand:- start:1222 stop:1614 length:393 start_codon:yes stop_codon:yes gene_type:complete